MIFLSFVLKGGNGPNAARDVWIVDRGEDDRSIRSTVGDQAPTTSHDQGSGICRAGATTTGANILFKTDERPRFDHQGNS